MGLDSVELVIEVEKFFKIQIADSQAEKINTVEDFTNIVAQHLNITSNIMELREKVFLNFVEELRKRGSDQMIVLTDKIADYLEPSCVLYLNWEFKYVLETPKAVNINDDRSLNNLKKCMGWLPNYEWALLSVEDFIIAICANNYKKLINIQEIKSTFEIFIAIVGITADKIGVDVFEINLKKSFTTDLGID